MTFTTQGNYSFFLWPTFPVPANKDTRIVREKVSDKKKRFKKITFSTKEQKNFQPFSTMTRKMEDLRIIENTN